MTELQECVLAAVGDDPDGVPTEKICVVLDLSPQILGDTFEELKREGHLRGFAGSWFSVHGFRIGCDRFLESLLHDHANEPSRTILNASEIAKAAGLTWSGKVLDRILRHLVEAKKIACFGDAIRHLEFRPTLPNRQRELLDRVVEAICIADVNTPSFHDLSKHLGIPHQAVEQILQIGVEAGEIVEVGGGVFYTPNQVESLLARAKLIVQDETILTAKLRDELGTTRKYVIPLLEYFERQGWVVRDGNDRKFA